MTIRWAALYAAALVAESNLVFANSCPRGTREEWTKDPCATKEEQLRCVKQNDQGQCILYKAEHICKPGTRSVCVRELPPNQG